ncbi:hypothetical protein IE81DRAFT_332198 [Ceraceosorus guamensis]|uniref:F-box domain-containing protein n=1 Tax=Ceraceosorus guamensis TaxID=1522189 RepID=A0A316VQL3_9BASI|nr:hypothetical protein IE81DRAFT_332198 [Ceraceosorus guamensis]PWN39620.1 hypothetical protein IE81DRAFT_332198 [Ceraceosorus guamensis]
MDISVTIRTHHSHLLSLHRPSHDLPVQRSEIEVVLTRPLSSSKTLMTELGQTPSGPPLSVLLQEDAAAKMKSAASVSHSQPAEAHQASSSTSPSPTGTLNASALSPEVGGLMGRLPFELWVKVMVQLDPKSITRCRRVSSCLKRYVDNSEDIWRCVAYQWKLIDSIYAPLPRNTGSPRPAEERLAQQNPLMSSATGYFNNIVSFRDLCRRHACLNSTWSTSDVFAQRGGQKGMRSQGSIHTGLPLTGARYRIGNPFLGTGPDGDVQIDAGLSSSGYAVASINVLQENAHLVDTLPPPQVSSNSMGNAYQRMGALCSEGSRHIVMSYQKSSSRPTLTVMDSVNATKFDETASIDLAEHFGAPVAARLRGPLCVMATITTNLLEADLPEDDEAALGFILTWDLHKNSIISSWRLNAFHLVEHVDFDAVNNLVFLRNEIGNVGVYCLLNDVETKFTQLASVCNPFNFNLIDLHDVVAPWYIPSSSIRASQIYLGTALLNLCENKARHCSLKVAWRCVEDSCLNPSVVKRGTLAGHIREYSTLLSQEHLGHVEMSTSIRFDSKNNMLIITHEWGLILIKGMRNASNASVMVGIIHYHVISEHSSSHRLGVQETQRAFTTGRVCQAMTQMPYKASALTHLILVDYDAFRLDTSWKWKKHPFENVKIWHIDQRSHQNNHKPDARLYTATQKRNKGWSCSDPFVGLHMDATTIYTLRTRSGLEYMDFGLASRPRSRPQKAEESPWEKHLRRSRKEIKDSWSR